MMAFDLAQCRAELQPEHAEVIRATLPLVGANIEQITTRFYSTMFEAHPSLLANLFNRGNQKQGAQQKALAASVATFASMLVNPDAPVPAALLHRIGHKHASLGVTEDQYQIVHDYLFGAIVEVLGASVVTAPVAAAWEDVYWIMARTLIQMEKGLYKEAGVDPGHVFLKTKVVDRQECRGGVVCFSLESADPSKPLPKHKPGQYISVRAHLSDGAGQLRQYSLLDSGHEAGRLMFAVKAVPAGATPAGEVSSWLTQQVQVGDGLEISIPFGDLVLDESSSDPVVLVSAGIGFTPMHGMLSRLAQEHSTRPVLCLHADKSEATDAFAEERRALVDALPSGTSFTWYEEGAPSESIKIGRLALDQVAFPPDARVYLCGPTGFLQALRADLDRKQVPSDKVAFELFSPNDWLLN